MTWLIRSETRVNKCCVQLHLAKHALPSKMSCRLFQPYIPWRMNIANEVLHFFNILLSDMFLHILYVFEYFKTCFAHLHIYLRGLTCIQSIVYLFVCAYVSDTFLSQSFLQSCALFWSETFCLFALLNWRCPHNYVLLLQRYNLQN